MAVEKKETKKETTAKKNTRTKKVLETEITAELAVEQPEEENNDLIPEKVEDAAESVPASEKQYIATPANPNHVVNVRSGAGMVCGIVKQIPNGTPVTVYEEVNGFGRIGDGQWVKMTLLK